MTGRTRIGCSRPYSFTESTSASMSSKVVRGCMRPALSWPIGRVSGARTGAGRAAGAATSAVGGAGGGATVAATSSSPKRADRPRPRPRGLGDWLMGGLDGCVAPAADELARQQDVGLRAGAGIVVDQHRQSVRRRLGDAHVARDGRAEHQLAKMRTHVGLDL